MNCLGPGDYNPKGLEKRVQVCTIRQDSDIKRRSTSGKINYLSEKDTSKIHAKLNATVTLPKSKLKQMEKRNRSFFYLKISLS